MRAARIIRPSVVVGVILTAAAFSAPAPAAPPPALPRPPNPISPPPPRPPANATASWNAIEALAVFLGTWHGTEVYHGPFGDFTYSVYRSVSRLGGLDVVLLEEGRVSYSIGVPAGPSRPVPQFDVIAFNVKARRYEVYMPGYRFFIGDEGSSQLVELARPDPRTITWSEALEGGASRRTTVTIDGPAWRERIENVAPDGIATLLSEINLTRDQPPAP